MNVNGWTKDATSGSALILAAVHAVALVFGLLACTKAPESTREPAAPPAAPAQVGRSAAAPAAASDPAAAPGIASAPAPGTPGPPPGRARQIRGYFRSTTIPETVRVWTGADDAKGWEQLTKLLATIDGEPVYSMAASAIRFAGICRSTARGFDQLLLSFTREPRGTGGAGILWYDAAQHRFALEFLKEDIARDPQEHLRCATGQSILSEGAPARPCLCPWADSPAGSGETTAVTTAALAAGAPARNTAGEIQISAEVTEPETMPEDAAGELGGRAGSPGGNGAGRDAAHDSARAPAHIPIEVEEYANALADLKAGKGTLEALLQAGDRAQKSLVPLETNTPLEDLSEEDYATVRKMMGGYVVGREVTLYVEPDPEALLVIARARGDAADVAFFESLSRTTDGVGPIYAEQASDFGACTKYGSKEVVAAYRQWTDYAGRFPGRYAGEVERQIEGAAGQLTEGTCACGDSKSVIEELAAFVDQFPAARIAPAVLDRIEALKSGKSDLHFKCSPG